MITLVYVSVFFFLLIAGALALYFGLTEEIDKKLKFERDHMISLFESDFMGLLAKDATRPDSLVGDFSDELGELYSFKDQFVIFSLKTQSGRRIYSNGGIKNVHHLPPPELLSKTEGFYNQRIEYFNFQGPG